MFAGSAAVGNEGFAALEAQFVSVLIQEDNAAGLTVAVPGTGNMPAVLEDVRLAVNGRTPVTHYGKMGGIVPTPDELIEVLKRDFNI